MESQGDVSEAIRSLRLYFPEWQSYAAHDGSARHGRRARGLSVGATERFFVACSTTKLLRMTVRVSLRLGASVRLSLREEERSRRLAARSS